MYYDISSLENLLHFLGGLGIGCAIMGSIIIFLEKDTSQPQKQNSVCG